MSPIPPPPAGVFVPSDDWSEDPSFDFDSNSPSAQAFALALPPSPSSSSSSSHHSRTQRPSQHHAFSPLRNSFTGVGGTLKLRGRVDLNDADADFGDDFDFDLPNTDTMPFPTTSTSTRSRPRSSTSSSITRTVIGQGPSGVGTITRLNSGPIPPIITGSNSVKARARAIEQSWEADLDFDVNPTTNHIQRDTAARVRRLTLSPPVKKPFMPPADALDDLGFDLDDDEEDQDQATLKAGATIKAMLPPPKKKPVLITLPVTPPAQDPDTVELEADFALPLNLTNLTLATQPHIQKKTLRPRSSVASTAESWDSPGTSNSGKKGWGWGSEDSPVGRSGKHMSETSVTSVSDGLAEPAKPRSTGSAAIKRKEDDDFGDEEDMEADLIIPSPTFFSNKRADELNLILDRKRRPQFAPQNAAPDHSPRAADDSFEDGLLLDEPGVELSRHRLREKKRARDKTPSASSSRRVVAAVPGPKTVVKEREKAWEKQREQNWGRNTPVQHNPSSHSKERTQSSHALGLSFRSNSASASALMTLRDGPSRRTDSPSLTTREREAMRSRSGHLLNTLTPMAPPPVPPTPTQQPTPSAASRLRHQKSHYHIAPPPPQSPNLTRKQSLASLQDALASTSASTLHLDKTPIADAGQTSRYHNSTSRLTMATSSSRAKARPPLTAVFPKSDFTPSSSASSISSAGVTTPRHRHQSAPKFVDVPRRKAYGDGTELDSIDDLMVEDETRHSNLGIGLGKPNRKAHDQHTHHQPQSQPQRTHRIESDKRKKSGSGLAPSTAANTGGGSVKRNRRKPAGLIKHLGGADRKKVVGEMTWNPATLRWEGNEGCLKDFDVVSSSARPALITHYTGSSVGISSPVNSTHPTVNSGSGNGAAPRIVGDMQFDPINMRWVSILSAEDEEPDPFEGMADDEDDEGGQGGATITRAQGRRLMNINPSGSGSLAGSSAWSSRLASESSISLSSISNSTSTTGVSSWRTHGQGVEMPESLWKECKEAEERHKKEMKGWITRPPNGVSESRERERKEEKRLWEIRHLALKS